MCPVAAQQTLADAALLGETIVVVACIMNMVARRCGHMGCSPQECKLEGLTFPAATC